MISLQECGKARNHLHYDQSLVSVLTLMQYLNTVKLIHVHNV